MTRCDRLTVWDSNSQGICSDFWVNTPCVGNKKMTRRAGIQYGPTESILFIEGDCWEHSRCCEAILRAGACLGRVWENQWGGGDRTRGVNVDINVIVICTITPCRP